MPSVTGIDNNTPRKGYGVKGTSAGGDGVLGISTSNAHAGVAAINDSGGSAVGAQSTTGVAVFANSNSGAAVIAQSQTGHGVFASSNQNVGVEGVSNGQDGVRGTSSSRAHAGVSAFNSGGFGVFARGTPAGHFEGDVEINGGLKATSASGDGVLGISTSNAHAGVSAINDSGGFGVWARGTPAGHFEGDVEISGNVAVGVGGVDPSFLANKRMVVGGNSGGSAAPNDLACFGAPVNGIPQGQIVISPDVPFIEVAGLLPLIELRSSDQVLQIDSGGIATPSGFRIGLGFPDKNAITIDSGIGGLIINSDLTVNGNAKFQGGKQGFLVDEFVNCSEMVLERGDLLTLRRTEANERYGDRIPVPQVELAREAYAVEICGVVDGPVLQPEHRCHDAVSAKVPPGARGLMVITGCYGECKVDADVASIEVGDLLTASSTPGYAQKVLDRSRAVGAIVGKALKAVEKGKATIPILVLLH
jgi:hypothetical protein